MYKQFFKRALDFMIALMAILLLSPLYLIVAILVRFKLGSPVIFKQERPGRDEKIFTLYKFRSMTNERDEKGELLPETVRLTKFGVFLRSTSLDELPQLFNVLKGEMSIIGPRPLIVYYLPLYNDHQKRRHEVRPGITGLAQVKGRNFISWEEKFDLDVEYIEKLSFLNDLRIVLLTIKIVLGRKDVYVDAEKIMEDFKGSSVQREV
ncbi:sugar transferase [Lysinibacillus sp. SGAir0095]|uniref:sugar transferase n=1 Tax=Lysinibacillus sp. SGAir0095 TaxID=2070463 RepID=UPI0010CD0556|nr:sugar transferase [Lysinibacillus sp. SGAir0095]QCR34437.1 sugar transferase [Lysinibacillus sp. SGAir0095]